MWEGRGGVIWEGGPTGRVQRGWARPRARAGGGVEGGWAVTVGAWRAGAWSTVSPCSGNCSIVKTPRLPSPLGNRAPQGTLRCRAFNVQGPCGGVHRARSGLA